MSTGDYQYLVVLGVPADDVASLESPTGEGNRGW